MKMKIMNVRLKLRYYCVVVGVVALGLLGGVRCTRLKPATPTEVATVVGNAFIQDSSNFVNWEGGFTYGPAVVVDGLYEAERLVSSETASKWHAVVDKYLDTYFESASTGLVVDCTTKLHYGASNLYRNCAKALVSPVPSIPWNASCLQTVGDQLGIFAASYLSRYLRNTSRAQDVKVAVNAAAQYVSKYQYRLRDGTFSRTGGCCDSSRTPPSKPIYLWADDQYMGMTLLARLAACTVCQISSSVRHDYVNSVAKMQLSFSQYLRDENDGLNVHGAKVDGIEQDNVLHSCCKWGRANGWGLMSHVEVLSALDVFPDHPLFEQVRGDFQLSVDSMMVFQDRSGLWHQVVNDSSTYLETSVTAMMVMSLGRGLHAGWLPNSSRYWDGMRLGWDAIASRVASNGTVSGVCMGTGILPDVASYDQRGTDFFQSSPGGVGAVLRAAAAVTTCGFE